MPEITDATAHGDEYDFAIAREAYSSVVKGMIAGRAEGILAIKLPQALPGGRIIRPQISCQTQQRAIAACGAFIIEMSCSTVPDHSASWNIVEIHVTARGITFCNNDC